MALQDFWFIALAALFLGFFVLEGFDFGVGMLMRWFGGSDTEPGGGPDDRERHQRAVLNTIGPVWDGNEVWLITAGGAMFAAFPAMYATLFSGLYLPLLAILLGMIVRVCAIEWRGKIDDPAGAAGPTAPSRSALGYPPCCGAWRSPRSCGGFPSTPTSRCTSGSPTC